MRNYLIKYGYLGTLKLAKDLLLTKIFFGKCRLIRFPIYIRGRRYIKFGVGFSTGVNCRIDAFKFNQSEPTLIFGDNVKLNDYVHIASSSNLYIGNNVLIASRVFITDHDHGDYSTHSQDILIPPDLRQIRASSTIIEDNVWIGENVSILPGVTIGKNSVIGASTVVNKDIPEYSICVGNPCRVVKTFCKKKSQWVNV